MVKKAATSIWQLLSKLKPWQLFVICVLIMIFLFIYGPNIIGYFTGNPGDKKIENVEKSLTDSMNAKIHNLAGSMGKVKIELIEDYSSKCAVNSKAIMELQDDQRETYKYLKDLNLEYHLNKINNKLTALITNSDKQNQIIESIKMLDALSINDTSKYYNND